MSASVALRLEEARPLAGDSGWGLRRLKVEPRASEGRGRGLFAVATIAAGEVIERACAAPISREQCAALDQMLPVGDFYFQHPEDPEAGLMLFGLVSLVNHADAPNAHVRHVSTPDLGWVAELYALQPIQAGEEITYQYRCPPWFAVA